MLQSLPIRPRLDPFIQHDQYGIHIRRQKRNHLEQIRARFPRRIRVKPLHRRTLPLSRLTNRRRGRTIHGLRRGPTDDAPFAHAGGQGRRPVVFCHFEEFVQFRGDKAVNSALSKVYRRLEGFRGLKCEDGASRG